MLPSVRVAEVVRTKILSPNIGYFVANSRFVAIYALFGRLWTKSVVLGPKQCFMVKKCIIIWYIYIVYYSEINLQLRAKMTHLSQISKYVPDE